MPRKRAVGPPVQVHGTAGDPSITGRVPDLVTPCEKLTIADLYRFYAVYKVLRKGGLVGVTRDQFDISQEVWDRIIKAVRETLHPATCLTKFRGDPEEEKTAGVFFHEGVGRLLHALEDAIFHSKNVTPRVIVQGTAFTTQWLLPTILVKSGFLAKNPDIQLEFREGNWRDIQRNLTTEQIDLGLGPRMKVSLPIKDDLALELRRALIYRKGHTFACPNKPPHVRLEDLSEETVFVLSWEAIPGFDMKEYLPRPKGKGRHVFVDAISHMYAYVQRGLGVALGYESLPWAATDPELGTQEYSKDILPPVKLFLYYRSVVSEDRASSASVEDLRQTILKQCNELKKADG